MSKLKNFLGYFTYEYLVKTADGTSFNNCILLRNFKNAKIGDKVEIIVISINFLMFEDNNNIIINQTLIY